MQHTTRPTPVRAFLTAPLVGLLAALALVAAPWRDAEATCVSTSGTSCASATVDTCPATSPTQTWSGADLDATTIKDDASGVVYDPSYGRLQLKSTGANFVATQLSGVSRVSYAVPGDFNKDGWMDFIGTRDQACQSGKYLYLGLWYVDINYCLYDFAQVYRNETFLSENCTTSACTSYTTGSAPNWASLSYVAPPRFTPVFRIGGWASMPSWFATAASFGWSYTDPPIWALDWSTTTGANDPHRSDYGFDAVNWLKWRWGGRYALMAGDFNGDGWDDYFEAYAAMNDGMGLVNFRMYLNSRSTSIAFGTPYAAITGLDLGYMAWPTKSVVAVDYNNDNRLDVLVGSSLSGGGIRILLNNCTVSPTAVPNAAGLKPCTNNPTFVDGGWLKTNLFGKTEIQGWHPVFDYDDLDNDGLRDLVVGAPACCNAAASRLVIFKGCSTSTNCLTGNLENTASLSLNFAGAATAILVADFSQDGRRDIVVGTDGYWNGETLSSPSSTVTGGIAYYYENKGGANPFPDAPKQLTTRGSGTNQAIDYDVGFEIDYDHDPANTTDVVIADGNDESKFFVLDNKQAKTYVQCGDVYSAPITVAQLTGKEAAVTSMRMTPSFTLNGGTITWYMSNEDLPPNPPITSNWIAASLCTGSTTDYCVTFPHPTGNTIRWKARLCAQSTAYGYTSTPTIQSVTGKFGYTVASEHHRAGVITNDGVTYVSGFVAPGDRGKFYFNNAGLTQTYWEVGAKLDALGDGGRNIYTALTGSPIRYDFKPASASDALFRNLLVAPDATTAQNIVNWVRSARFGLSLSNPSYPLSRFGAVVNSTPAIVTKPGKPSWYAYAPLATRGQIDAFISANASRVPLVLFGAEDGMIHAVKTKPTNITDAVNASEAWAFIPSTVAARLYTDYTATKNALNASTDGLNQLRLSAYPDGSPTLVDYDATGTGTFKTAAIISDGTGGSSLTALDVTSTVDPSTGAVSGPTPLWSWTPGAGAAGQALSKAAVARVKIGTSTRTIVIAATGPGLNDTTNSLGRIVQAFDLSSGLALWSFQTMCAVTSDITVFETDDSGEFGTPTLDGYVDRAVFADKCGNLYKVNPAQDLSAGFMSNGDYGTQLVNTHVASGAKSYALFTTYATTGAGLGTGTGAQRPIAGTIAARTDGTTDMVLFFGTGGLDSQPPNQANGFYAIYAKNGNIRSKYSSNWSCTGGCEKYYGGTLVTPTEVIFTRTIDPVAASGTCDQGSTVIQAMQLNQNTSTGTNFTSDFAVTVSSAIVGALFGDAGALYFSTLGSAVGRIGTPRTAVAGGDSATGFTQGMGTETGTGGVGSTTPLTLMGWRSVL